MSWYQHILYKYEYTTLVSVPIPILVYVLVSVLIPDAGIRINIQYRYQRVSLFEPTSLRGGNFFFSHIYHNNKQQNIVFMHINIVKDWEQLTVASRSQSRAVAVAVVVMLSPPPGQTARLCTREALTFGFKR